MPVTCRGCLQRYGIQRRLGENWDVSVFYCSRMLLLFGKGEIAVFDSVSVGIIVLSGSRHIL